MFHLKKHISLAVMCSLFASNIALSAAIEEVTVTAQRKTENLQDIPAAISAIEGDRLRFNDIATLDELDKSIPGLTFSPYSEIQPEIAIRGVGTKEDGPAANDSTVISVDDVYIAARIAQVFDIYDLQRVEVLRGPQGTLYGRNSIGGSINFVTEKPNEEFKVRAEQTFGKYNKIDTRALISGPLSNKNNLFGKISVSRRTNDGYTPSYDANLQKVSELNDKDSISARTQLVWAPSEDFEAIFSLDGARDNSKGANREPINTQLNSNNLAAVNQQLGFTDKFDSLHGDYGFIERDVWGASAKLTWTIDDTLSVTSITSAREASADWGSLCCGVDPEIAGASNSATDEVTEDASQLTQEIQVNKTTENSDWVFGLFLTKEADHRIETFHFPTLFIPPAAGIINNNCVISDTENCVGTTDASASGC